MNLLPMRETKQDNSERMISLVCGVPSLTLGIGGLILLLSFVGGMPVGSGKFHNVELVTDDAKDVLGNSITTKPMEYIVPSHLMLWTLWLGACSGGLGMHLTRLRWANRSARTSASGLIVCSLAYALSWLLFARAFL
jgi:hypothetical protein